MFKYFIKHIICFQTNNKCVFYQIENDLVILCLNIDDLMILGCNIQVINIIKSFLSKNFNMKDFGHVDVILGVKLLKSNNDFDLTQSHYIEKILKGLIILICLLYAFLLILLLN
jgi:ATP-binding cassette subfamily B (MDR/TAP) protein 1